MIKVLLYYIYILGFLRSNINKLELFQVGDIYIPMTVAAKTIFADSDAFKVRYILY